MQRPGRFSSRLSDGTGAPPAPPDKLDRHGKFRLWLKFLVPIIIGFLVASILHGHYEKSHKFPSFTIISLLRDMTAETLEEEIFPFAVQWSALMSWTRIVENSHIIVFVDTEASCEFLQARLPGLKCSPVPCWNDEFHKPLLSCLFDYSHKISDTDLMVYVNGDICLGSDLGETISHFVSGGEEFALVGRRTDTRLSEEFYKQFRQGDYVDRLQHLAKTTGTAHSSYGIDLFVYNRQFFSPYSSRQFPPFLAGVYRWDNWLLSEFLLAENLLVADVSNAVLLVHQEKGQVSHQNRPGAQHNDDLVKRLSGTAYKIGTIDNVPLRLEGKCPDCEVSRNRNVSRHVLFTRRASSDGYLVVLTVNSGYIPLALNWVCWAERINFNNYILIAEDQLSAQKFRARGIPVFVEDSAPLTKPAADYGSVEFQETMTFRTEFLLSVLNAGFHFVTADMDGLWLDNPLQYFNHSADLQGQTHKEVKISGGFVVVRASTYGRYFWNKVIECQRENSIFLASHALGTYEPSKYTEQYCINELSRGLLSNPQFHRFLLDPYKFPDGKAFFDEFQSQMRGVSPAVIHNNWIVGADSKLNRLKQWGLQAADDEAENCLPATPPVPEPVLDGIELPASQPFQLKLRVMTMNRGASLQRLLDSLAAAHYDGDQVILEISIDLPNSETPSGDSIWEEREAVRKIAKNFEWSHGSLTVIEQTENFGLVGQWTRGWIPAHDREFCLFLEDDVALSPFYYRWLRSALVEYFLNPEQRDPLLFGLSLQRQQTILGESPHQRYGSATPEGMLLNREHYSGFYYKYQLLGSWGALFAPTHWKLFLNWLVAKQVNLRTGLSENPDVTACVPTLLSNKWWRANPHKVWTAWFIRFSYEHGFYSLYTNFPSQQSLLLNYREAGLNFKNSRGATDSFINHFDSLHTQMPPLRQLPLFDFHFERIATPEILSWRQQISNPAVFPQCWTMDLLKGRLEEMRAAKEAEEENKRKIKEEEKRKKKEAEDALKAEQKKAADALKQEQEKLKQKEKPAAPPAPAAAPAPSKPSPLPAANNAETAALQAHRRELSALAQAETAAKAFTVAYDPSTPNNRFLLSALSPLSTILRLYPHSRWLSLFDGSSFGFQANFLRQHSDQETNIISSDSSIETLEIAKAKGKIQEILSIEPGQWKKQLTPNFADFSVSYEIMKYFSEPLKAIEILLSSMKKGIFLIESHHTDMKQLGEKNVFSKEIQQILEKTNSQGKEGVSLDIQMILPLIDRLSLISFLYEIPVASPPSSDGKSPTNRLALFLVKKPPSPYQTKELKKIGFKPLLE